ncbi:MAG: alpha-2-macroglobulin [Pseudomonadota bacterium]
MTVQKPWMLGIGMAIMLALAGLVGFAIGTGTQDGTRTGAVQQATSEAPDRANIDIRVDASGGPDQAETDAAEAQLDENIPDGQLRYFGKTVSAQDDVSEACFRFSSAPDPDRVVDDKAFVRIEPDAPFSLQVRDRSLCIIGLDAEADHTVTILPGLQALDGAELRAAVVETVAFAPKPAMVGFVGDGIILPRSETSTLGIRAMNVDAVELTLYRVNHRALFDQSPETGETTLEGDWSWNGAAWQTRVEVHKERVDTAGDVNEVIETGIALEGIIAAHGPGAYIAELSRVSRQADRAANAWRWLFVTDMALAAYRTDQALDVTVRSIDTAETQPDVRLTLIARNNEVLAEARSDESGRAQFPGPALRGTGNLAPKMVMAYSDEDDFAALDLSRSPVDLTAYDVTGRIPPGPVDAFVYTERGVYRPGETVHMTGLIRDGRGHAAFDRDGTLRILRPDGTEFSDARISPRDQAGALVRQIRLPAGAARGRWTARLSLDGLGEVGSVRFAVEDFIPEQLRLDLRADDGPVRPGTPRALTVAADFLYGATGRGLDAEAEARVSVDPDPFPQWSDYTFGNAAETYREQIVPIGQGMTDADGLFRTDIDVAGEAFRSSAPLRLFVTAGVAEPGGRYVRDSLFLPLRSEPVYVGFDPAFEGGYAKRNTPATLRLVAVNADGKRVALSGALSLIREDYDYHWYRENGRWRYRRDRRDIVVDTIDAEIGADVPLTFSRALDYGQYRLRFTTDAGAVFSYQFGSGWRRAGGDADAPDRVEIGLSQAEITPGETVVLSVNSPFSGTGELVIADRAIRTVQTVRIEEGGSEIRLPVARDWTSDLYAMLTVYGPASEGQPRRAVGLVHMPVGRSSQRLAVSIEAPDTIRPRRTQDVAVKVAVLDGEAAFMTLAAVDTGILQITDYSPPEPESYLFGKLAFPIDLFDDYARMLAPYRGADRSGGDTLGGAGLSVVPTTIVSLFEGPVEIEDGVATVSLDLPDFQGELTLMAVAWSETKLGSASTRMTVRDPVTVQLALPRFLAPGDRAVATVAMDNIDGQAGQYEAIVDLNGSSVGTISRTLEPGTRSEDRVKLVAGPKGISTYRLAATGPDFDVSRDYNIETRTPSLPVTRTQFVKLEPGERRVLDLAANRDGFSEAGRLTRVSASFSPGPNPALLLASLQRYPYGCTEQTVSVAMPLLIAESYGGVPGMSEAERANVLQAALDTVLERQDVDGAFGLWRRGDGNASPYLQLYASDFVLKAAAAGFSVPATAKDRTLESVRLLSDLDNGSRLPLDFNFGLDDDSPDYELRAAERAAYAFALLARHDRVKKTDLLYLDRRFGARLRPSVAQSQLGYALAALGEADRARAAFSRAAERLDSETQTYYDSPVRNAAALLALGTDLPENATSAAMMALQSTRPEQLNTHEKAWLLRALAGIRSSGVPFSDDAGWTVANTAASRSVDGNALDVLNDEASPVFLQITVTGVPTNLDQSWSRGAILSKSVFDMSGGELDDGALMRGERYVVLLDASGNDTSDAMWVLADLLPAGVEIETVLGSSDAGETGPFGWLGALSDVDMVEARDDRFVASWRTQARYGDGNRRLAYVVRAVTQGEFAMPGAHLEDMYRPGRTAQTAGGRIQVTPPPTL